MIYQVDDFSYDSTNGIIFKKGEPYNLSNIQNKLLNYLIQNSKIVLSKQTLMDNVWERIVSENSVDQIIYALRNLIEKDPTNPSKILTHFGKGISFEGSISHSRNKKKTLLKYGVLLVLLIAVFYVGYFLQNKPASPEKTNIFQNSINLNQQLLILPTTFNDSSANLVEQHGMNDLLWSSFNNLDNQGKITFDKISLSSQQAVEKHWQLNNNLTVLSTNVIKNGEIYEAIIELTKGSNKLERKSLKANSLSLILSKQISFISSYNQITSATKVSMPIKINTSVNQLYIEALGHKKLGNLLKAKTLLETILINQEDNFPARLSLADILLQQKQYDKSESQFTTLKSTAAYQTMATEIELGLAKIKFARHDYNAVINNLKNYQAGHLFISQIKKAKIHLYIAKGYRALGDIKSALKFYQQSLLDINLLLNPEIYAQSYYGQGKVLQAQSNNQDVLALFEQSLTFAQASNDIHQQVLTLNEISNIALSNYDWDKATKIKKHALQIMELDNDKEEIANGLGTLVAILNIRGNFSEAKKINLRLKNIAIELNSDALRLHYLHYDAVLAMNFFDWRLARQKIDAHLQLAQATKNYPMQLNNAFLEMELLLLLKDTKNFKTSWDNRVKLINENGFARYQIYMDVYLIRYYNLINQDSDAITLAEQTSEQALAISDISVLVDAQNTLAEIYLKTDAKKALVILNNIEQHNPQPNPYLEIKARVLNKLGKHIEAFNILNQAKLVYNESWTAENQALLEIVQKSINY